MILFKIETEYRSIALYNLNIDGFDLDTVAYHCKILADAGLLDSHEPTYGDDRIYAFSVGSLTWAGHDFLDKIRENTLWNRTKDRIKDNALPMSLEVIVIIIKWITSFLNFQSYNEIKILGVFRKTLYFLELLFYNNFEKDYCITIIVVIRKEI